MLNKNHLLKIVFGQGKQERSNMADVWKTFTEDVVRELCRIGLVWRIWKQSVRMRRWQTIGPAKKAVIVLQKYRSAKYNESLHRELNVLRATRTRFVSDFLWKTGELFHYG